MIITTAFWGGSFVAGKIALREFPPMTLLFFRLLIATVFIFPIIIMREKRRFPASRDILLLFELGLLGVSAFFVFQFYSLLYTSESNSSIINALNPLISSVLAAYIANERLTKKKMALIFIALFGVLFAITTGDPSTLLNMRERA
ncbi:EamA family transporter [Candidatus Bathyarchaeota archaeon]|nr:MAG: EamA family transporter [Candidatus Bathyarchaeota archaeon]